jgi:lipopolysaccharide/colanic/teichoic acid biosynthesis glycosyltransferase
VSADVHEPHPRRSRWYARTGKRALDLAITLPTLLLVSPVLLVVAALVRLQIGAPVLFRQERPGRHGRPFILFKFRTMNEARDSAGLPLPDVHRLTPFGRWLRGVSLDELPELWNIVRGDMSLVGPRPLLMQYLDRYTPAQARRHEVRPGLTGWAQINGRNAITWDQKFALDVWYVDRVSWWLDVKIIARTFWKLVSREGISSAGEATMSEFLGQEPAGISSPQPPRRVE